MPVAAAYLVVRRRRARTIPTKISDMAVMTMVRMLLPLRASWSGGGAEAEADDGFVAAPAILMMTGEETVTCFPVGETPTATIECRPVIPAGSVPVNDTWPVASAIALPSRIGVECNSKVTTLPTRNPSPSTANGSPSARLDDLTWIAVGATGFGGVSAS